MLYVCVRWKSQIKNDRSLFTYWIFLSIGKLSYSEKNIQKLQIAKLQILCFIIIIYYY